MENGRSRETSFYFDKEDTEISEELLSRYKDVLENVPETIYYKPKKKYSFQYTPTFQRGIRYLKKFVKYINIFKIKQETAEEGVTGLQS